MNKIYWSVSALKQLKKMDNRYKLLITENVNQLVTFPEVALDIKKLQETENQYRLRVGRYRVVFEFVDGVPKIVEILTVKIGDNRTYNLLQKYKAIAISDKFVFSNT